MASISLCMIVKDEEETLGHCLESVKAVVDEIIIVDTGSTDKTKEIAQKYTDKLFDFVWINDFSAARNYSFSLANCDYILWLDADDIVKEEDAQGLLEIKARLSREEIGTVYLKYHVEFDELGTPTYSYYRERIVKRSLNPAWIEPVHEVILAVGRPIYVDFAVTHCKKKASSPRRNLNIIENVMQSGATLSPRLKYYYARELMLHKQTKEAITMFECFLADENGWPENKIGACQDAAKCYQTLCADLKNTLDKQKIKHYDDKRLDLLLNSFKYDAPRPKTCCMLGAYFSEKGMLKQSIYWYEVALLRAKELSRKGNINLCFTEKDYFDFIPLIQLCVLHWRAGNKEKSVHFNTLAGEIKPFHPDYQRNKSFFEQS